MCSSDLGDIKDFHKLINLFLEAENKIRYANNQALVLQMIIPEMMKPNAKSEIKMVNRDVKKNLPVAEEKKEVEKEESKGNEVASQTVTVDDIKKQWDRFIDAIKPFNHHLYAFVGGGQIRSFEGGTLHLEVPFNFHKERIEAPKSKNIICEVFSDVYGIPCKIECYVNPAIKPVEKSDADEVLKNLPVIPKKEVSEKPKKRDRKSVV